MAKPHPDSEAALELETIKFFQQLDYTTANCCDEWQTGNSKLGRETKSQVILTSQLHPAIQKFNPHLPPEAVDQTIEIFSSDRSLSTENANREIYKHLKDGLTITYRNDNQEDITETIQLIDWRTPQNNNFFLASQFWITGETYTKRADLIAFINGIPLIFIELKAHTEPVEKAYTDNFTDYKTTIPQLFQYNGLVILSNGSQAKLGSITSTWEYFSDWKKINSEGETGIIDLETLIRGTCDKGKLLDIVENFTLFVEEKGKLTKIVARNHQYLGVNKAVAAVEKIPENQGKLGVFWHTQGSGKSYSMQFFAQKVHRVLQGNWTFVVITDREDLDKQIYQNFGKTGAVTEPEKNVRATCGQHLKQLLTEDHRYIFTLIQKFRTAPGETYPKLSDRDNIIVMADEAHRSQYDIYAGNMRLALPNAAFIGFTGTPLIAGVEEATRREFGEYVSIYNFRQSIEDGATMPLYYENRVPELQLTNEQLNDDITNAIETADVDEDVEVRLAQEFSRQYEIIVRDNRLKAIAADIVSHFLNRGFLGKAMIVSIDRFTTVKMYDKVQHYWQQHLQELRQKLLTVGENEREKIANKIKYMEETDMAVIVSASQNEKAAFEAKGLNIVPHRERLAKEKPGLDEKFKDENNGLRIVFVCAMWMTGFDVPSCSTIYIDKPMKNHTLMQTIARANRVFQDKNNGLIVDYIGVLRNLQSALAIYGSSSGGGVAEGDIPVKSKLELVEELKVAIGEVEIFLTELKISLKQLKTTEEISQRIKLFDDGVDAIVAKEDYQQKYLSLSRRVRQLYKAILPDALAKDFSLTVATLTKISKKIYVLNPKADISEIKAEIGEILDDAMDILDYVIPDSELLIDLSQINFDSLKQEFQQGRKNTIAEKLKNGISSKLSQMLRLNTTRMNYYQRFQKMINDYNLGSQNIEAFFQELIEFSQLLNNEEKRGIAEGLDEEKLAIFDLLAQPDIELTEKDKKAVKQGAEELLNILKQQKLVIDWRQRQQSRAAVKVTIEEILDENLPDIYSEEIYELKCQEVYQHIYESYVGGGKSIYQQTA